MSPSIPSTADTFTITTPIYYVNDRPHIGHCYTTVVADAAARFHRLAGRDVFFLTGTDEHGQKVEKSAASKGVSPQQLADENAKEFEAALKLIGSSNDDFIRTTQPRHTRQVQAALSKLIASDDVYLGTFEGWYDEGQEEYVTENQAREQDYKGKVNGAPLVKAKENNYYFRLSKWQAALEKLFAENPEFVRPKARLNEVLGRLRDGLQDVPVSRTNFTWGIPVPGEDGRGHVTYVWIDALLNYTSAVGLIDPEVARQEGVPAGREKYWPADVHVIGKEILWFHAVIWPALLMALGLDLPKCIYAHSFWVRDGKKMSKTLGNFVDLPTLQAYIDRFGVDAVRWYLLTQGPLHETDADFSYTKFVEVYNADLANGIGNCTSRVGNMIEKYFGGRLPAAKSSDPQADPFVIKGLMEGVERTFDWRGIVRGHLENATANPRAIQVDAMLFASIDIVREVDVFINATQPFKVAKLIEAQPEKKEELGAILYCCAEALRIASVLLSPAMPGKMAQLWSTWGCTPASGARLSELAVFGGDHALKPGSAIAKGEALFMRADVKDAEPGKA